ncbi:magnesium/nickel/cobalt transporter [Gammaproteobacteria bacterium]|nr:magnesium/nickel/cobalt transporter [Gammaproteobacteria bacterium]
MLTAFVLKDGRLEQTQITSKQDLSMDMIWIDMVDPDESERLLIEEYYKFELPEKTDIKDIEASARFYEDEDGIHIHSFFLNDFDDNANNITVAFSIYGGRLFTLHDQDLTAFRLYRMRARRLNSGDKESVSDVMDILLGLHETSIEHVADILEGIYSKLETVSQQVLRRQSKVPETESGKVPLTKSSQDMAFALSEIAIQEDINGKARLSLMDTRRSLSFLLRGKLLTLEQTEDVKEIMRDIESLTSHTSFLFDKVNFLLDASMGMISLEQSKIIKIFSIASVVFLPPTVVASVYGMNFEIMPELKWQYGYIFALALLVLSGVTPYLFFKRKGWL